MRQQAGVLVQITKAVAKEIRHLRTLSSVERDWSHINRLEREGDRVYRRATADLFSGDHPAIEVLKWKDIVDQVEDAIDRCQHISNTMESIALKYAERSRVTRPRADLAVARRSAGRSHDGGSIRSSIPRSVAQNNASPAIARFSHRNSGGVGGIISRNTSATARKNNARREILIRAP